MEPRDAGKAIAVNRNLRIAVQDINVIPRFEVTSYIGMRRRVGGTQVRKRLAREYDAPAKCVVRPITLPNRDQMLRISPLHKDCKIQPRRSATDDVDFHLLLAGRNNRKVAKRKDAKTQSYLEQ